MYSIYIRIIHLYKIFLSPYTDISLFRHKSLFNLIPFLGLNTFCFLYLFLHLWFLRNHSMNHSNELNSIEFNWTECGTLSQPPKEEQDLLHNRLKNSLDESPPFKEEHAPAPGACQMLATNCWLLIASDRATSLLATLVVVVVGGGDRPPPAAASSSSSSDRPRPSLLLATLAPLRIQVVTSFNPLSA